LVLGPTHYRWDRDVERIVGLIERRWPRTACNTYLNHPWPGWDSRSIDVWGPGGRGHPLAPAISGDIRSFLMRMPGAPYIRHTIHQHQLWTSFGGYSWWSADDHSGNLSHLHVTYWP
jgi:hypothetical protein